jgi:hypothetical protein
MERGEITAGGLHRYPTFVHYDIRGVRQTWAGTSRSSDTEKQA